MGTIKRLNVYMKGSRGLYLASWIAIALAAFFGLLQPQILRIVLDVGISKQAWTGAPWITAIIGRFGEHGEMRGLLLPAAGFSVVLMGFSGGFFYLKGRWSAVVAEDTARRIRNKLYGHLQHLNYSYYVKSNTGDLIQRCTSDVETIRGFLANQAVEIGRGIFLTILTFFLMSRVNVPLTWISMSMLPIIFSFGYIFFLKVKHVFSEADACEGRMSSTLQENISGIRVVRAFARREHEIEKFDIKNADFRDKNYRLIKLIAWYWSISDLLCFIHITLVMAVGGLWAAQGKISLGTAVLFFTYIGRLLWPVRQMGRILTEMGKTSVSLCRIQAVLDEPTERETGEFKAPVKGGIEFSHVSFQYEDGRPILEGVSFKIEPGEIIAILGPTGSGKSTLVNLIPRLYDPTEGEIFIDGVSTLDWDRRHLREQVCIILQESFLFNRSVRDNISLALPDISDEMIYASTKVSSLHDVIESFEKGYQTIVGEGGVTLSGGQKQRVALARTLVRNPKILILDDSLSAVDPETDFSIRASLKKRYRNATIIIIAHRTSTLSEADRILVLEKGKITQEGRHSELVRKEGLYKRIRDIQNADFQETSS